MNKQSKKVTGIFIRYFAILILGLGNLYIFYKILTPITIYTLKIILSIFSNPILKDNIIQLGCTRVEIVPACIAGAAFYLLLILLLTTSDIKPIVRAKAGLTAIIIFFVLNITRILILTLIENKSYFEAIHWIFWHLISTIFVVATWIVVIKIYKIKSVPIYSDLKYMKSLIHPAKKTKRKKKNN